MVHFKIVTITFSQCKAAVTVARFQKGAVWANLKQIVKHCGYTIWMTAGAHGFLAGAASKPSPRKEVTMWFLSWER